MWVKDVEKGNKLNKIIDSCITDEKLKEELKCAHNLYERLENILKSEISYKTWRMIYVLKNTISDDIMNHHERAIITVSLPYNISLQGSEITITFTTCKRYDLFTRTMNSFLTCVLDIEKYVSEIIVIDDNSSEEDVKAMKYNYPFIRLIQKGEEDKGHPRSMNILISEVKTRYQFHVEDDWEFFEKRNYCYELLDVIKTNSYGQVLVNVDYTEDQMTANTIGGSLYKNSHFVHNYYKGDELVENNKKLQMPNNFYWPHFSFRVGLTDTNVYKTVGKFNEKSNHFEMEYANRYVENNYKTAFLAGIYCTHIGRRTYERSSNKLNAYDLNKEQQFGEGYRETRKDPILIEIHVINLKRRVDRLISFFKKNPNMPPVNIFEGVDGKTLKPTLEIKKIFETGDYNFRKGIVGCAMSHIQLWKKCVEDINSEFFIILEDDVTITQNFTNKILYLINEYKDKFDLMFLHYNPYPQFVKEELYKHHKIPEAFLWTKSESIKKNMGSGAGYIMTKQGASNLLNHIDIFGVYNAIDWVMFKCETNRIMYSTPMIVHAQCAQDGNKDSDIQPVYESINMNDILSDEIKWWKDKIKCDVLVGTVKAGLWLKELNVDEVVVEDVVCNNKIIIEPDIEINDKRLLHNIILTKKRPFPMHLSYVYYSIHNVLFIVPHRFCSEDFLERVPLFDKKIC
jgi:GR25 family glycosyltransferase involved in LPS biosynthesis